VLFERIQSVGLSYKKSACKGKRKGMITSLPTTRISAISLWQTFLKSFTHKMAAKASWHQNYVAVTLCVGNESVPIQLAQCWFPEQAISSAKNKSKNMFFK